MNGHKNKRKKRKRGKVLWRIQREAALFVRIPAYVIGLLIMTLGVAISVKSNLGVSPVSSIPYTITCVVGLEMGKATILFHAVLVLLQILLLRRAFQAKNLLQILQGFCSDISRPLQFAEVFFPDRQISSCALP